MIIKEYVKKFEKHGFGMFVHFGLYSALGKGEWSKGTLQIPDEEYFKLSADFQPVEGWADHLARVAKDAGCKYITLTTRHHDGYSLYDTCGLNDYDAPHTCGRDLVREFVDACRKYGLVPMFYHTLLDWYEKTYYTDFQEYLKYLRRSIEILCKNYGEVGGFWFDGMWARPDDDWEEDALYGTIRKYQPEAMIINNTGLSAMGALGHIELDSVTFERGKPEAINMDGAPKYVASEMCEVFASHWGYAKEDLNFKAPAQMIRELADCRRYGSNMLLNIGPKGDGSLRAIDEATYEIIGQWVRYYEEALRNPRPCGIEIEEKEQDFLLKDGKNYYLFCYGLPMSANVNVALSEDANYIERFRLPEKIRSVTWLDNQVPVHFCQEGEEVVITTEPFTYGRDLVVRVAKIVCE